MANILLTQKCVRSCPYCFAKEHMKGSVPDDIISWDNIISLVDLHLRSRNDRISLLGGEPALHPHFPEIIKYMITQGLHVNVFTSGIVDTKIVNRLQMTLGDADPEYLSFVVNCNHPSITPPKQQKLLDQFLSTFSQFSSVGYNIYKNDFDLDFLFNIINKFGLKRHIRVGLAQPIPLQKNTCLTIDELPAFVDKFMSYADTMTDLNIKVGFDCGIPLCVFPDALLGKLFKITNNSLRFGCGPAIDIGPDMNVWSCFPLSNFHKKSIFEFKTLEEIHNYYHDLHEKVRGEVSGIYEECDDCKLKQDGLCSGGCLAHTISVFESEERFRFEEVYLT